VLGRHDGVIHFTVGQRKGLGLSGNEEPLFVLALDAARAASSSGRASAPYTEYLAARRQLAGRSGRGPDCAVKVRSMRAPVPARVTPGEGARQVELAEAEEAIAPGQACVFYKGDRASWAAAGSRRRRNRLGGGGIAAPNSCRFLTGPRAPTSPAVAA
jgi:tRNA-specific 2-thiouridylase